MQIPEGEISNLFIKKQDGLHAGKGALDDAVLGA